MKKDQVRVLFIVFGLLDIISLYRNYHDGWTLLRNLHLNIIWISNLLLIVSLLFSSVLLLLSKKAGLILYYFQYPLRLIFSILSLGFLHSIIHLNGPMIQKMFIGVLIGLETIRLYFTIRMQRAV